MLTYDTGQVGSVGTLIGAALETAGQQFQSIFLDVMANGLGQSLGMLFYLLSCISAIFIVAIGGNYKFGLYLFLAPALFYQVTLVRIHSDGAMWKFGDYEPSWQEQSVTETVAGIASNRPSGLGSEAEMSEIQVSWVFSAWNKFSSEIIQTLIQAINALEGSGSDGRKLLSFANSTERYFEFYRLQITDPAIKRFIVLTTQTNCSDYFALMHDYFNPALTSVERQGMILTKIKERANDIAFGKGDEDKLFSWFKAAGVNENLSELYPDSTTSPFELVNGEWVLKNRAFTCHDTWVMTVNMLRIHGESLINELVTTNVPKGMTSTEVRKKLQAKFTQLNRGTEGDGIKTVIDDSGNEAAVVMLNELAVRLFVNELSSVNPDIAREGRSPRSVIGRRNRDQYDPDVGRRIRLISGKDAWQGKGDYYSGALALPYIQGLVLYFLAAGYPFFAFCLLVPGRHKGFLLWMSLWLWAKSWDLGFAMVMVIDTMLYAMMPHGPPITPSDAEFPEVAIKKMLEVDPTYSEQMYYNLLAACMISVPSIMGILIKKGGGEIVGAIQSGYDNFAGYSGHSMASYYGSMKAQDLKYEENITKVAAQEAAKMQVASDPEIASHYNAANNLNALASYIKGNDKMSYKKIESATISALKAAGHDGNQIMGRIAATVSGSTSNILGYTRSMTAAVLTEMANQHKNLANSKAKYTLGIAPWREGTKELNHRLASDAVALGYYSHDFMSDPPFKEYANYVAHRNFLNLAKVADSYAMLINPLAVGKSYYDITSEGAGLVSDKVTNAESGKATTPGQKRAAQ